MFQFCVTRFPSNMAADIPGGALRSCCRQNSRGPQEVLITVNNVGAMLPSRTRFPWSTNASRGRASLSTPFHRPSSTMFTCASPTTRRVCPLHPAIRPQHHHSNLSLDYIKHPAQQLSLISLSGVRNLRVGSVAATACDSILEN